eukprot:363219-Chlamydomonas_euryale.AAC.2
MLLASHRRTPAMPVCRQERAPDGKVPPARAGPGGHEQREAGEKLPGAVHRASNAHRQARHLTQRYPGAGAHA